MSSLHWSAEKGHLKVVEYLISQGADIDSKTNSIAIWLFRRLLFIVQLQMAILMFLRILLIMAQILMQKPMT